MLMTKERQSAIRTLPDWAIDVLQEAGAIRECEEHGWAQDRADPRPRTRRLAPSRSACLLLGRRSRDGSQRHPGFNR
jgi:hypothetical protein